MIFKIIKQFGGHGEWVVVFAALKWLYGTWPAKHLMHRMGIVRRKISRKIRLYSYIPNSGELPLQKWTSTNSKQMLNTACRNRDSPGSRCTRN
jgi:hypothetical protein